MIKKSKKGLLSLIGLYQLTVTYNYDVVKQVGNVNNNDKLFTGPYPPP